MATSQDNNSTDPTDINEVLNSLGQMVNELDACAKDVDKVREMHKRQLHCVYVV